MGLSEFWTNLGFSLKQKISKTSLTLNRPGGEGGSGIRTQAGSSLCCAETVSSRKLKLCDFYCILVCLNSEYKLVPWDIHCCHGNAIVEGCSVKFWLKSVENCNFLLKSFSNFNLGLLFVISISKLSRKKVNAFLEARNCSRLSRNFNVPWDFQNFGQIWVSHLNRR